MNSPLWCSPNSPEIARKYPQKNDKRLTNFNSLTLDNQNSHPIHQTSTLFWPEFVKSTPSIISTKTLSGPLLLFKKCTDWTREFETFGRVACHTRRCWEYGPTHWTLRPNDELCWAFYISRNSIHNNLWFRRSLTASWKPEMPDSFILHFGSETNIGKRCFALSFSSGKHLFNMAEYMGRSCLNLVCTLTFHLSALATWIKLSRTACLKDRVRWGIH